MFFNRHNNYDDYYGPNTPGMEYSSAMSTASVILAFLSIFSSVMFYIAVPAGALSILFALLSRGRNRKIPGKSRIAVFVSVIGITASVVTTVVAVRTVMTDPRLRSQLEYMFDYYAQELGLDIEFDDYFGGPADDDTPDPDQEENDRANDYFNRYFGNGDDTPGYDQEYDNRMPEYDIFGLPENPGGNSGGQQTPSGGKYI